MATISEVMRSISKSVDGEGLKTYLNLIRDMPLMAETPERTAYNVGQREMALELLNYMEEKDE